MKRVAITIVLNGDHHLKNHYKCFPDVDQWIFVEGASESTHCTKWCKSLDGYHKDGHSVDDTLESLRQDQEYWGEDKVKIITQDGLWDGKVSMFNRALQEVTEPCWLWQIDVDEYWRPEQLKAAETVLENLGGDMGAFACDYYLTDDIVVRGDWGESITHGYRRLFKYTPGCKFLAHEPPVLEGCNKLVPPLYLPRFKHYSYYYEQDVKFKAQWYGGHENIYEGWKDIVEGRTKLPCKVEALFKRPVDPAWTNTIITYA